MSERNAVLSRIVGVEEHVVFQELTRRLPEEAVINRGHLSRDKPYGGVPILDKMAARIAAHPTRYAGFAHLPLTDPYASAEMRSLRFEISL